MMLLSMLVSAVLVLLNTHLRDVRGESFEVLCETIKKTAFKITRVGQLVAQEASKRLGVPFGIIDLSLAPTPAVGDQYCRDILKKSDLREQELLELQLHLQCLMIRLRRAVLWHLHM